MRIKRTDEAAKIFWGTCKKSFKCKREQYFVDIKMIGESIPMYRMKDKENKGR